MLDNATHQLLVFRMGDERFGVPLTDVDEVMDAPAMQRVPDAAPFVLGMATIAGQFTVVYDPRPLLHVGGRTDGAALLFIHEGRRVALAVEDVFDALTVSADEIKPAPPGAPGAARAVTGVVRRGSELIAIIDTHALLDAAMHAHAGGERQGT